MSSLLQHHGSTSQKPKPGYVELLFYRTKPTERPNFQQYRDDPIFDDDAEPIELIHQGQKRTVAKLYRIWRKPIGMFGCWVMFSWNGSKHAPDLSVPIRERQLPKGAEPLTDDEMRKYWFS